MAAPRKDVVTQRVLKVIIPPKIDSDLQALKLETGVLVAEHVRQAIALYLSFWEPGKGVDVGPIYALSEKLKEERNAKK